MDWVLDGWKSTGIIVVDVLRRSELFSKFESSPGIGLTTGKYNALAWITCPGLKAAAAFFKLEANFSMIMLVPYESYSLSDRQFHASLTLDLRLDQTQLGSQFIQHHQEMVECTLWKDARWTEAGAMMWDGEIQDSLAIEVGR